jgi:hypothetical protein
VPHHEANHGTPGEQAPELCARDAPMRQWLRVQGPIRKSTRWAAPPLVRSRHNWQPPRFQLAPKMWDPQWRTGGGGGGDGGGGGERRSCSSTQ